MAIKACLNGGRARDEHPAVPISPEELAGDARAVREAGAFAVHVHPRDARGAETLAAAHCEAAIAAIRAATPGLPVGLSTSEAIDPSQHEQDLLRERCLLYVACTRARDRLVVTSSGRPSTLLPA